MENEITFTIDEVDYLMLHKNQWTISNERITFEDYMRREYLNSPPTLKYKVIQKFFIAKGLDL